MTAAQDKQELFLHQTNKRAKWFAIATVAGLAVALFANFGTDIGYPSWRLGVLVHGILFWPMFLKWTFSKSQVSAQEAMASRRDL